MFFCVQNSVFKNVCLIMFNKLASFSDEMFKNGEKKKKDTIRKL